MSAYEDKTPYVLDMENRVADINFEAAIKRNSPSYLLKPRLFVDGNQWCALYGENIQEGVAGFGDTPEKAFEDFNNNFSGQVVGQHK